VLPSLPFSSHVARSFAAGRRLALFVALATLVAAAREAAPAPKRYYDLAEGDASRTLRFFVEQSGVEIVYVVTKVRGVQTNAVQGELAAREVLHRMLAGTALMFVEDAKTAAITVVRNPPPEPESGSRNLKVRPKSQPPQ
jgi:hypothetical protein